MPGRGDVPGPHSGCRGRWRFRVNLGAILGLRSGSPRRTEPRRWGPETRRPPPRPRDPLFASGTGQREIGSGIGEALLGQIQKELEERRKDTSGDWFGDVYGYEDTGRRYDLKLRVSREVAAALTSVLTCLEPILHLLRPSWEMTELAAMCTFPGDPGQPVHADTSHVYDQQVVTTFVALHDIPPERGPTKMYPFTHLDGEVHLGLKEVDEQSSVLCSMSCGDCVIMDSRLLHCGTANSSEEWRVLFYSSWMPPVRRSRGSTNTILSQYEEQVSLRNWRERLELLSTSDELSAFPSRPCLEAQ